MDAAEIDLGNGTTGRRQEDGSYAVYREDGQPAGFSLNAREVAEFLRSRAGRMRA